MGWTDLKLRVRALLFRSQTETDLEDEVGFHLEMEARKNAAAGYGQDDARRRARADFGGADKVKEECRDRRGTRWLEDFLHDVRFGLRTMRKDRGYALAAISALAIGIGANTALFMLFAAVVLKPMPVRDPGQVVSVFNVTPRFRYGTFSFADYLYYRDHNSVFSGVAGMMAAHLRLAGVTSSAADAAASTAPAEGLMGLFVTANYFDVLGASPVRGRGFSPEDDRAGPPYPALLSESYWERRFSRDPGIFGKVLMLSGIPATVVGITPRGFMGTRPAVPDVWLPMAAQGDPQRRAQDRTTLCCELTARMKPGMTLARAQAELSVLAQTLRREYPQTEPGTARLSPAGSYGALHVVGPMLYAGLQVAIAMVLLIACANVAGLLLGRAAARRKEIAVRLSMGATRGRLVRQLATESILIALAAGFAGLLVTWGALANFGKFAFQALAVDGGSVPLDVTPGLPVFAYLMLVSVLSGITFALAPALQATKPDIVSTLKGEGAGFGVRGKARLRGLMVAGQIAVCLLLLIGAGMLAMDSVRMLALNPGYETRSVLSMSIMNPQELGYSAPRAREFQLRLRERLRAIPGVRSVAVATRVPMGGNAQTAVVAPPESARGSAQDRFVYSYVSPEYFETLGMPLVRGRTFTAQEAAAGAPVTIVSEALARRFWPGRDAVGRQIAIGSANEQRFRGQRAVLYPAAQIVGVVRDAYNVTVLAPDAGYVYLPKPTDEPDGKLLVRTAGDTSAVAGALAAEAHAAEPGLAVTIETLESVMSQDPAYIGMRVSGILFAAIGILGLVLASVAVYSMVAYTVSQQMRETGIRMALGAQGSDVLRVLMGGSLRWIAAGVVTGVAAGLAALRVLASVMVSLVQSRDQTFVYPGVLTAIAASTAALAIFAAWLPARRAARLDPAATLRME